MLSRSFVVPLSVVDEFYPQVTKEASTGQNVTAVGNPKATRSVIYANDDNSKKVTITVRTSTRARLTRRSAYEPSC